MEDDAAVVRVLGFKDRPTEDYNVEDRYIEIGNNKHVVYRVNLKSLNRLRTHVDRCRNNLANWGSLDPSEPQCHCGAPTRDMCHFLSCPACATPCLPSLIYTKLHTSQTKF